ncbi:hypothetical protein ACOSQ4_027193 [Xanthoceras sorbifolium]
MSFDLKLTLLGVFADPSPSALALLVPKLSFPASELPFTFIPGSSTAENLKIPAIPGVERRRGCEDSSSTGRSLLARRWRTRAICSKGRADHTTTSIGRCSNRPESTFEMNVDDLDGGISHLLTVVEDN